jgi:hypothetical protein
MLDHLEQLESYFGDALRRDAEASSAAGAAAGGDDEGEKDEFDREEEEQAREDLAAIEQDLPRAKSEVLSAGCQMTGVMADIIAADFREALSKLFTPEWERANLVTIIANTALDYFGEARVLLDGYFFDRLVGNVLTYLTEQYVARLLGVLAKKERAAGGFGPKFKLTEERLKRVVADIMEVSNCFAKVRGRWGGGGGRRWHEVVGPAAAELPRVQHVHTPHSFSAVPPSPLTPHRAFRPPCC